MAAPAARTPRPIRYRDAVKKNDSFLKTNSRSKRKLVNHRATGKCTISGWYKNGIQVYSTPFVRRLSRKCHATVTCRVARWDKAREAHLLRRRGKSVCERGRVLSVPLCRSSARC